MKPKLTRELAWAAAQDAGNRAMRKAGRHAWNRDDYNIAAREFDRLWPEERDYIPSSPVRDRSLTEDYRLQQVQIAARRLK